MSLAPLSRLQLSGQTDSHLTTLSQESAKLHPDAATAYLNMRETAAKHGIHIAIASGYRDLQRQLAIWNRKWLGELVVNDAEGKPLTLSKLTDQERLHAILHWSALPGSSRHHWGTDCDVYDPSGFNATHKLQLIPAEYCDPSGPCYALWQWLCQHAHEFGFFFPYARYQGGVAQEPWHLSYRPLSYQIQQQLTVERLAEIIDAIAIEGKSVILDNLEVIYKQYIINITEDNGWTNTWCGYSSF